MGRGRAGWGLGALLAVASPAWAGTGVLAGQVVSGTAPIAGADVTLYAVGTARGLPATPLASAHTDAGGTFRLAYPQPDPERVLYVVSEGGTSTPGRRASSRIVLATVLGPTGRAPAAVTVSERSTVATAYALAWWLDGTDVAGSRPGVPNAAPTVPNLVDPVTGGVGPVLGRPENATTLAGLDSLADLLAVCVGAPWSGGCTEVLRTATPSGGIRPADTLALAWTIARHPTEHVDALFDLVPPGGPYQPSLGPDQRPVAWTVAVKHVSAVQRFDGPGNLAVDAAGDLWITNNYDGQVEACGGTALLKLAANGLDAPGAPFTGGGIYGAGFGIGLDPLGRIWVGNFGFEGSRCADPRVPDSVSLFTAAGQPLSPSDQPGQEGGFTEGGLVAPQGTVSDPDGNIWIASYGEPVSGIGSAVTVYPSGRPGRALAFDDVWFLERGHVLQNPFDVAVGAGGVAWVTSSGNDRLFRLRPVGTEVEILEVSGVGLRRPLGVAVDSVGNAWVASSGGDSVTAVAPDGTPLAGAPFVGGGLQRPWGVAVDGQDNVWVANFAGSSLTQLCGAAERGCPRGVHAGEPISPPSGYTSDTLARLTGVVVDTAGNVWVADNWKTVPAQTNPGGDGVVQFVGLAPPIRSPLIGLPQGL